MIIYTYYIYGNTCVYIQVHIYIMYMHIHICLYIYIKYMSAEWRVSRVGRTDYAFDLRWKYLIIIVCFIYKIFYYGVVADNY